MSKKTFFRKLLIAGLCVVSSTAVVGAVASCKKKDDDNKKQEEVQSLSVQFDLNGGTGTAAGQSVNLGGKIVKPADPVKSGHSFDGWYLGETKFDFDTEITQDFLSAHVSGITLSAKYIADGSSGGEAEKQPTGVTLDTVSSTSNLNREFNIVASISNASELSAENKVLTWTVEKPDVASITVSSDTLTVTVKCTAVGSTKITAATKNNKTAVYNLTVVNPATGIEITKDGKTIDRINLKATDDTANLVAKISPEGSSDTDVQWSASLDNVVEITPDENDSSKATVKMLQSSSEQFTITATVGEYSSTIFCTCDTYYGVLVNDTQNLILNKNFSEFSTGDVLDEWNGVWGSKGIYGAANKCTYGEGFNVTITTNPNNNNNNRAEIIDKGAGEVSLVVDFGAVDGVVKGYTNVQVKNVGNGWTPIRIYGVSGEKPVGGEIFGLRTEGGEYKYRLNGGSATTTGIVNSVATSVTTLRLYYEIDLSTHKLTVVINGQDFLRDLDIGITEAWGMQFVSGDNNSDRTMSLDNIAVTHVPLSLESYKAVATANLNAVKARYDALQEGNIYTTENYNELTGYHTAGLQAIDGALTKEDAIEAYETAVENMAGVETIAATALKEAKAAYIQAQITDVYTDTKKAEYKYNAATLEEKIASFTNAVNAYSGAPAGIAENANVIAAKQALEAVKTDVQVITGAKEAAVEEIEAYKGGSENYEENASDYSDALTEVNGKLDLITLDGQEVTAQLVTDLLGQINEAVAEFKEAVDGIDDDATALENAQAQAKTQIDNLYLTEIAALNPEGGANYTADEYTSTMSSISDIRDTRKRAVDAAETVAAVQAQVTQADTAISGALTTLTNDLPAAKLAAKAKVDAEIQKAATANPDLADGINALQSELYSDIEGAASKSDLTTKQTLALRKINVYVAKERAYGEIADKVDELKADLHSVAACAALDEAAKKGSEINSETWNPVMWQLHNAIEEANVTTHKNTVLANLQQIYDDAIEADYTVTLGTTGETLTVKYGTKLLLEDLKVTAKTVVSATYNGNNIDNTDGLTVYDDITIEVVCEDIENFEPQATWSASAETDLTNIVLTDDNDLFMATAANGNQILPITLNMGKDFTHAWQSNSIGKTDGLSECITIIVKENLSDLSLYLRVAGTNGTDKRQGHIYFYINSNIDDIKTFTHTDTGSNMQVVRKLENLHAGDQVVIAYDITGSSGGRLHLFGIDAQVKNATPDVDVKWQLSDGTEYETNLIHYYDALVAPEATPEGEEGQKFDGWYYTPEGESSPVKFVDGTKFPSGSNIVMTAHFLNPNVIIHYTGNGGTNETKKFYLEDGATITLPEPTSSVEGEVFAYWTKDSVEFNLSDIQAGTSESPAEYTLVAHFQAGIPVTGVTITGSSSVEVGSKITLTATVEPDNASNKDATWTITDGSDCATINAATGELTGVKAGTVKVTATAGGVPSAEFTVTVTPKTAPITVTFIKKNSSDPATSKFTVSDSSVTITPGSKFNSGSSTAVTINDKSYTDFLKLESGTSFTITSTSAKKVTLWLSVAAITVGGTDCSGTSVNGVYKYEFQLAEGETVTIARKSSGSLYLIELV